jgi:hypothetical protein
MTQTSAANYPTSDKLPRRSWRQLGFAVLNCSVLLAVAGTVVAVPFTDPGPVYPIARWIVLTGNQSANSAHLAALEMDGYQMTPAIKIELDAE